MAWFVHSGGAWRDQVRETVCTRRPSEKEGMDSPWMVMEQRTMKATIGWIVAASSSVWFAGGFEGTGSFPAARVDMKTPPRASCVRKDSRITLGRNNYAPIPIGPK